MSRLTGNLIRAHISPLRIPPGCGLLRLLGWYSLPAYQYHITARSPGADLESSAVLYVYYFTQYSTSHTE
jgi:hypothetical protein